MELYDKLDNAPFADVGAEPSVLRSELAFLAENPEAFGLISDAFPVATTNLLIAANGYTSADGGRTSLLDYLPNDGDDTPEAFFNTLFNHDENAAALFRATFGARPTHREQPVSRYSALVAEALTLRVLQGAAVGASMEQTCVMIGGELRRGLGRFRDILRETDEEAARDPEAFTVSLGACRVTDLGCGDYTLDVFVGGDYRVFLLDETGMAPLWNTDTTAISPDSEEDPVGRSIRLHHPEPFAVLLLSGSVCELNAAEGRAMRNTPGLIWRHRMRLEDHFLRLITACVREKEFGERAAHLFTGRCRGRDCGGGAVTVFGGGSFEAFRAVCQKRLIVLEKLISLIPDGS